MILVNPSVVIMTLINEVEFCELIEKAGRTAYKSEKESTWEETVAFVKKLVKSGHESVLEHVNITVKLICDRGVTHELVRHRIASYTQESTRYCNYSGGLTFVIPPWVDMVSGEYESVSDVVKFQNTVDQIWFEMMLSDEKWYIELLNQGWIPQQARSVLPNSLKTEIVTTCNIREWRHILKLRTAENAHPQMREIMSMLLNRFKDLMPTLFGDIEDDYWA